jgi:FHS family L-fucose permease-like MFS transporter
MIFGFIAQFCYVGAQVTIASFFINYATENATFTAAQASNLLSYALITFTVGRFVATGFAIRPILPCKPTIPGKISWLTPFYAAIAIALNAVICSAKGNAAVGVLITIFFLEAPMYPTLFTIGTENLGRHTRRGAGILVMGVSGGAVFPSNSGRYC